MQAVLEKTSLKLIKNDENETITSLLKKIENADPSVKSNIENKIVSFGEAAIAELINAVMFSKGAVRGIASMSLIRIGFAAIEPLKKAAKENANFKWVADYLTKEIEGSQDFIVSRPAVLVS